VFAKLQQIGMIRSIQQNIMKTQRPQLVSCVLLLAACMLVPQGALGEAFDESSKVL
jgi:hypothetical protein